MVERIWPRCQIPFAGHAAVNGVAVFLGIGVRARNPCGGTADGPAEPGPHAGECRARRSTPVCPDAVPAIHHFRPTVVGRSARHDVSILAAAEQGKKKGEHQNVSHHGTNAPASS